MYQNETSTKILVIFHIFRTKNFKTNLENFMSESLNATSTPLSKGIVGAVVIFDHGRKFGIFSIAPDHPAPRESFAIKKNTKLFLDIFF
jgi:hypothetical protein